MQSYLPCPNCNNPITEEDFEDYSNPFTMKCPHCQAKIKETKVTKWLLLLAIAVIPLFIFIAVSNQNKLAEIWPFVDKIPTMFIFLAFSYPVYVAYEKFNARILVSKGHLELKK